MPLFFQNVPLSTSALLAAHTTRAGIISFAQVNFAKAIDDISKPIWNSSTYFEKKDELEKEGKMEIKELPVQ